MYSLCSVSILYRTRREPTPSDILQMVKYGNGKLNRILVTSYWGIFNNLHDSMEKLKEIPPAQYQHWFYSADEYLWEGVILYEDGRAVCAFDTPYGRG